jgi:hypothetical protein
MFDFERRKSAAFVTAKPGKTYQRADISAPSSAWRLRPNIKLSF